MGRKAFGTNARRAFRVCMVAGAVLLSLAFWDVVGVLAQPACPTCLDPLTLTKWLDEMPSFGPAGVPRLDGRNPITIVAEEFRQNILPSDFKPGVYQGTLTWGYAAKENGVFKGRNSPGITIEAWRGTPTNVTYSNNLPGGSSLQKTVQLDKTLYWADPDYFYPAPPATPQPCFDNPNGSDQLGWPCDQPYFGPPPISPHLHGGEVAPQFDGGPESWVTSDGRMGPDWPGYRSGAPTNTYMYPNQQEAAPIWFHDHALGETRLNVYSGLAAFYLIRDPANPLLDPANPNGLPSGIYEKEIAIQDRTFDVNGEFYFTTPGIIPPAHPYWNPEFFGDVVMVNGKVWPKVTVEPRRYLFHILNGSNARFYNLFFGGLQVYQVGTDGGLLDNPVRITTLLLAPGERASIIIDFARQRTGRQFIVRNNAKAPYPNGLAPNRNTVGQILKFVVGPAGAPDTSYNPASGAPLRVKPIERLAPTVARTPHVVRTLTLNEKLAPPPADPIYAGLPTRVMINNTPYNNPDLALREVSRVGATEEWEIVNLTVDAHPIHLHLIQFQVKDRQAISPNYVTRYNASFPGGVYLPEAGPPLPYVPAGYADCYAAAAAGLSCGGNPPLRGFLSRWPIQPRPEERGWKDTVIALPNQVTRVLVRYAPTETPATVTATTPLCDPVAPVAPCVPTILPVKGQGVNLFPFDPTGGQIDPNPPGGKTRPGFGYVWHCHIIDHEDNEMMRPNSLEK